MIARHEAPATLGPAVAACTAVAVAVWGVIAVVWPKVPVSDPAQSETAGLIATIDVALIVIVPAVVLVLLQVLSPFSSRTLRVVAGGPTLPVLAVALVAGGIVPVWVDASPSTIGIRIAFVGFGLTIGSVAFSALRTLQLATPQNLADYWTRRTHRQVLRIQEGRLPSQSLPELAAALAELAGTNLPNRTHQQVIIAWALVVMARAEVEPPDEIVRAVEDLAAASSPGSPTARQGHNVAALAAVGLARCRDAPVHAAVGRALREVAARARASGEHTLGHHALDAVVDIDVARLTALLPDQRHPTLTRRTITDPEAVKEPGPPFAPRPNARYFRDHDPPVYQDAEPTDPPPGGADAPAATALGDEALASVDAVRPWRHGTTAHESPIIDAPGRVLRGAPSAQDILDTGSQLGVVSTTGATYDEERSHRDPYASSAAFDLIRDSVAHLSALLAAPRPDGNWPGGWQGVGALDHDVRRIGRLALSLYEAHRYPTGAVEEALENIAVQLAGEDRQQRGLPPDRTGWRTAHTPEPTGPNITVAKTLAELTVAAFAAGFDRRALLTGRRLLAAATVAVQDGDTTAADAYAHALDKALNEITRNPNNTLIAYQRRDWILLAGLIAEFQPLLEALGGRGDQAPDGVAAVIHYLPWRTYACPWPLASLAWRARLAAVGWPASMPGVSRVDWSAPTPAPTPLRPALWELAESELQLHMTVDPDYPAALLISLWANAVINVKNGDLAARIRLRDLLQQILEDHDKSIAQRPTHGPVGDGEDEPPGIRPLDPQLRRLAEAAIRWTRRRDPHAPAKIPRSFDRRGLRRRLQDLLDSPDLPDWHYHGLVTADGKNLVLVAEKDGSRRLLRNSEASAYGPFAWGYGGDGPHALARVLTDEIFADVARCPHCLGAAPCGAQLVTCTGCAGTGSVKERTAIAALMVERVISGLPDERQQRSPLPDAVWTISRSALLAAICRHWR